MEENERVAKLADEDISSLENVYDEDLAAIATDYDIDASRFRSRASLVTKIKNTTVQNIRNSFRQDLARLRYIIAAVETREMLKWSAENSAAVKMHLPNVKLFKHQQALHPGEQSYQVYQIVLKNVTGFPRVESIDDVLRLRDDRCISGFRELVIEWAETLRYGNGRYAELLRRDIVKANREVTRITDWTRTSALSIFLAFPLWAIDKLKGTHFCDALMIASGIFELRSRLLQRQNKWILLGR